MTRCTQEPLLTPFLLGDLPEAQAAAMRQHLDSCATCRQAAEEIAPTLATLRTALAADAAADLRLDPRRRQCALSSRPQRAPHQRVFLWFATPRRWLPAAAAILVIAAVMAAALFPAVQSATSQARCTAARSRLHAAAMEQMAAAAAAADADRDGLRDADGDGWKSATEYKDTPTVNGFFTPGEKAAVPSKHLEDVSAATAYGANQRRPDDRNLTVAATDGRGRPRSAPAATDEAKSRRTAERKDPTVTKSGSVTGSRANGNGSVAAFLMPEKGTAANESSQAPGWLKAWVDGRRREQATRHGTKSDSYATIADGPGRQPDETTVAATGGGGGGGGSRAGDDDANGRARNFTFGYRQVDKDQETGRNTVRPPRTPALAAPAPEASAATRAPAKPSRPATPPPAAVTLPPPPPASTPLSRLAATREEYYADYGGHGPVPKSVNGKDGGVESLSEHERKLAEIPPADFAGTAGPAGADSGESSMPFSPAPGALGSVGIVKSPIKMKGIYASRTPGARGSLRGAWAEEKTSDTLTLSKEDSSVATDLPVTLDDKARDVGELGLVAGNTLVAGGQIATTFAPKFKAVSGKGMGAGLEREQSRPAEGQEFPGLAPVDWSRGAPTPAGRPEGRPAPESPFARSREESKKSEDARLETATYTVVPTLSDRLTSVSREIAAPPPPANQPSSGRVDERLGRAKQTKEAMKEIVLPEVSFKNASIRDVVAALNDASKAYGDEKGKRVQFELVAPSTTPDAPRLGEKAAQDPFAGAVETPSGPGTPINFNARYISLSEAAKIVTEVSGYKLRYRDGKVLVMPLNMPDAPLETKTYTLSPALNDRLTTVSREVAAAGHGTATNSVDVTKFFGDMGVPYPTGASMVYDARTKTIRVTNTEEHLAEFEEDLKDISNPPPPTPAPEPVPSTQPRTTASHFNPFVSVTENRFSTFAIDVDTASYTLTRQAIVNGQLPNAEVVRTEEIVNAFDYGDTAPDKATFRVYVEGAPSPFGTGHTLLRIGVKGRRLGREEQRPAVLTFLIDTSGSMAQPDRIGLAREALRLLLDQLAPRDRIQIVSFDDQARLVLPATSATEKKAVLAAFDRLQCRGSTNLEGGMRLAYRQAVAAFVPGAENRVILVSDGVANLGSATAQDILQEIDTCRRQGITCSVFGVGRGTYNDAMLEELANKGDGVYRFLDSVEEVRRAFVDDLAANLNTIAADVKIQVEWNAATVAKYRQLGYENRALRAEQFRDDTVDAGEVGSGQSVTALYELDLAAPPPPVPMFASAARRPSLSLGTVRVRYRRTDTRQVEEIEQPIVPAMLAASVAATRPQFRLAAGAAEFAEILRGSPFAAGGQFEDVARLLRPVALDLALDTRVKELLSLVEAAGALSH